MTDEEAYTRGKRIVSEMAVEKAMEAVWAHRQATAHRWDMALGPLRDEPAALRDDLREEVIAVINSMA